MRKVQNHELTYEPVPTAKLFHDCVDAKYKWYVGGYGSGKSTGMMWDVILQGAKYDGTTILILRKTYASLVDSTKTVFDEVCPSWMIKEPYNKQEHKLILHSWRSLYNHPGTRGVKVIFGSIDHPDRVKKLMSMNVGIIVLDEADEFEKSTFLKLTSRLRDKRGPRQIVMASNSAGKNWQYKLFQPRSWKPCPHPCTHFNREYCVKPNEPMDSDWRMFVGCTMENKHLPEDFVASQLALPEEMVKRYVYCSFDIFAGQVLDEWDPSVHLVDPFEVPDEWRWIRGLDHGLNHPTVCEWARVHPEGFVFFTDEHYRAGRTPNYHAEKIIKKSPSPWTGKGVADPRIFKKDQVRNQEGRSGKYSIADIYRDEGLHWLPADNTKMAGIIQCKQYLQVDPELIHPLTGEKGSPRVFLFKGKCKHLEEEIPGLEWESVEDSDDVSEEVSEKNDDCTDVFRYILMTRPRVQRKVKLPSSRTYGSIFRAWEEHESAGHLLGGEEGEELMIGI